jgi:diguanylate cyclase (GGDEF)-like protein/PAS domain S-box-containing protein
MPHRAAAASFAAVAIGAGVLLGLAGWPLANRTFEFAGLIAAAILTSAFAMPRPATRDWATMTPAFVVDFIALLLLGPHATMLVAGADTVTEGLTDSNSDRPIVRALVNTAIVLPALQAAGAAYVALGGTLGRFAWPMQGVPIAAAIVAYCLVKSVAAEIVLPLVMRTPINRAWSKSFLRGCPTYFIGASLAVALAEVIDRSAWEILPVIAVPLFFAYRAYSAPTIRLAAASGSQDVPGALEPGLCSVDSKGVITSWNDTLAGMLECPRARANNRALVVALPPLAKTELPRAIDEAMRSRNPRTLPQVALPMMAGTRVFEIRLLPGGGGVTLLWRDVTEQARAEYALRRSEERFALAAEGSNDGLWEFDVRSKECYFSGRWRTMIGLPAFAGIGHLDEWVSRVHADDVAALKDALEAHIAGKAEHFQHEHRLRHQDGSYRRVLCRGAAVRGAGRRAVRVAGSLTDTTERAIAQEQLRSAGFRDPLTGLCNRTVFVEGLGRRLEEFKKGRSGGGFATLYLDLDRFKIVNDSLGHLIGDELLTAVSRRLESCLRQGDALARLGGDEFAILLNELEDEQQSNAIAFRIQKALSAPFSIGGREVFTSASIGIAFGRVPYNNPEEIMRDADTAMYYAKSRGKARHELFDSVMHAQALDRLGLENDLRRAVDTNDFQVHYQPIVLLATGKCVGFESLVRWSRNGEPISPATFVPMAEELGLIESLGTWVLKQACATFAEWQRRYPNAGLDYITVNVSSRQLMQHNFLRLVEQALQDAQMKPCDLRLEITETALMDSPTSAAELLRQLRDFGVKIYLDDFGTGYSSLSHLHKLPVDALKIDRSFVNSLLLPDRSPIVESILALARTLNTSVVAEGIETEVQARELVRLGCTHAQGYLFSKPLPTNKVEEILVANKTLMPAPVQPANPVGASSGVSGPEWPERVPAGHAAVQPSAF